MNRHYLRPSGNGREPIDPIAVERIVAGNTPRYFTAAERAEAVAILTRWGLSAAEISERVGVTERSVVRYRARVRVGV